MTDKTVQLKSGDDNLFPLTNWQGMKDMPANTSFNMGDGMHFVAHRGNNAEWPENSIPAFKHVTRHYGVETDISITSDGYWVVMHDDSVDRTTNGTGKIADMTLAQIQALRIDTGSNVKQCTDDELKVPTVDQYLAICKDNGRVPFLEIKAGSYTAQNYDDLAAVIAQYDMARRMVIISFSLPALQEMKSRIPYLTVSFLANAYSDDAVETAKALGTNAGIDVGSYATLTAANVAYAHSKGVSVNVWTTSDKDSRDTFRDLGVDFITTNGLSGDLRYATLSLQNGWKDLYPATAAVAPSHVEEMGGGLVHIAFLIDSGTTKKGTTLTELPDWAKPYRTMWTPATVRTTSALSPGTLDIHGRLDGKAVLVGIGWDSINTNGGWIGSDSVYHV